MLFANSVSGEATFSIDSTEDVWVPLTDWIPSTHALHTLDVVLTMVSRTGNGRARPGLQVATHDARAANDALNPSSATKFVNADGAQERYRFDPNAATDGDIASGAFFRLGVLANLRTGTSARTQTVRLDAQWR